MALLDNLDRATAVANDLSTHQRKIVLLLDDKHWVRRNGREYRLPTMMALAGLDVTVSRSGQGAEWRLTPFGRLVQEVLRPHASRLLAATGPARPLTT